MTKNDQLFFNRLNEHPKLRERIEGILDMIENETGNFTKANDAEQYAIEELRKMGNDILHSWAGKAETKSAASFAEQNETYSGDGKKKSNGIQHTD
jgi:uncharacterized protein YukE